jgi:flagellin
LDIEGTGTVPTIATTFATAGSGAVAINPTDGKVTLSGAFAADDKITMTINGQSIQTTLTDTDIIDTGAIAVNGSSALSAGEYYITSMGTTDFTTSNSGISASVTSPIADSNDGATGLGSIITVASNTTSLTGTGRVKAIKTDADVAAASVGNQFKVVNSEPVLYASALSATSVADAATTTVANSTTYLVTEGQFRYNGNDYTAGQSFAATTSNGTTATASGASMLTAVTVSTISSGGSLTNGQIGNSASAGHTVALVTGQSYLVSSGTMTYNSVDYSAGSTFTAISGGGTAAANGGASSIFTTGSDFNAGEVIEKAAGVYIGIGSKLVEYDSPAAAAQQIVAKLQAEGITGLNLTDNIDGTFDIVLGGNLSVASATDSHKAINSIDLAMQMVSADRAMFGALSNRFDMSISNLSNVAANSEMSLGRLQDADFAAETSRMTTSRILEQASIAMMAQANAAKQNVLQLLG